MKAVLPASFISFVLLHQMNYTSVTRSGWSPCCVSSLCLAVPSPPQGETEARERLRKPDTNRFRDVILIYAKLIIFFAKWNMFGK